MEGTFIEVNALASVDGEDPLYGITEGLPTYGLLETSKGKYAHCNDVFQESGISLQVGKPVRTPDELQREKMSIEVRNLLDAE